MTDPPGLNEPRRIAEAGTSATDRGGAPGTAAGGPEDARTQRRRLAAVWFAAGSAVAAMVAVSWYVVVRNGGVPPGGDMNGHAAAAEWLRTLPWWDWRGWSDWFYGGQAIGVNYPPLPHAWMRFTHPTYGQMAAVTLGLLVLLPWGALRLARAVGAEPRMQRTAVAAVLVLVAAARGMHWILGGFHMVVTFFGSWPSMVSMSVGLFCAAWSARCRRPLPCGVVAGLAVLINPRPLPGVAVVCLALLATSGASFRQAVRWAATAGSTAVAVCAWWLVPFVAGRARLVPWEVPLAVAWRFGGVWQEVGLAALGVATAWVARSGSRPCRRLALAAGVGLLATLASDLFGYLRPERWLMLPVVVAAVAVAGLGGTRPPRNPRGPVRPAWAVLSVACLIIFVVVTGRREVLPVAAWLLWWPQRLWAAVGALAWTAVLLFVPFLTTIRDPAPAEPPPAPLEAVAAHGGVDAEGLVFLEAFSNTAAGDVSACTWAYPWRATIVSGGRLRPLHGLYADSSPVAEFVLAERGLRGGHLRGRVVRRPHWSEVWEREGAVSLDTPAAAAALGARWYAACDAEGSVSVTELSGAAAGGVTVTSYRSEEAWHRAAVEWWISIAAESPAEPDTDALPLPGREVSLIPILSPGESTAHPLDRPARGVSLSTAQDRITVQAEEAGWAWLRIPWDPDWRSVGGTPVRKGGPGHLVVWVDRGATELRWAVPDGVDISAVVTTGAVAAAAAVLAAVNRRRGFEPVPGRRRPAAEALVVFADTVDSWAHAAGRRARWLVARARRGAGP